MSVRSPVCKLLSEERHTLTGWIRKDEQRRNSEMWKDFWQNMHKFGIKRAPPMTIKVW